MIRPLLLGAALLASLSLPAAAQCDVWKDLPWMQQDSVQGKPVTKPAVARSSSVWTIEEAWAVFNAAKRGQPPVTAFTGTWTRVGQVQDGEKGVIDYAGVDVDGVRGRVVFTREATNAFQTVSRFTSQADWQTPTLVTEKEEGGVSISGFDAKGGWVGTYACRLVNDASMLCTYIWLTPPADKKFSDRLFLAYVR